MAKNDTPEEILRRIIKEGTQTAAVEQAKVALAQLEESKKQTEILDKIEKKKDSPVERSTKKTKEERKEYREKEESKLSRVTEKVSRGSAGGGITSNIGRVIGAGTIAASIGSVPSFRGVAAATLEAAGVGGLVTMGAGGGGSRGGRSVSAGGEKNEKNTGKESVGILESILNVLNDNNELLRDLLASLTDAARERIEAAREANRKGGEPGKGVTGTDAKELEEQSFLGKWGKIIAAALGSVYGIIQGWLKTVRLFAELILPESLIKSIKSKFAAIGTFIEDTNVKIKKIFTSIGKFVDDIFLKLRTFFTGNLQKIGVVFEEAFSKISNLFKSIGSESRLANIITAFGRGMIKLAAPFIEAFNVLKSLISGPANYIVNVLKSFSGIFTGVSDTALKMFNYLKSFSRVFTFVSGIVTKLAYPLFIVMTVWDTVKGLIEGYEKEGIIGAIAGAVTGLFNSLLFGPLDMLKDAIAWVLGKFGFENAEKELNSFSFSEMFTNLIGTVKDFFIDIKNWVGEKMAGASASFSEWWNSWTISDVIIIAFEDFKMKVSNFFAPVIKWWESWTLVDVISSAFDNFKAKVSNFLAPVIEWWNSWTLSDVITKSFDEFKTKVGNILSPVIEWWNSWSISGVIISAFEDFKVKVGGLLNGVIEWWNSWTISGVITTAFEEFKQKIINYFGPEFVAKIGEIASFDLAGYISEKIGEVFKIITDFFAAIPGVISTFVTDQIKKIPGGETLLNYLTPAESSSGMAAGRGAEREVLTAITKMGPRGAYTVQEMAGDQRFNEAEPTFTNQEEQPTFTGAASANFGNVMAETGEQPTFTGAASANFGNVMAETAVISATDLIPTENQTAPAFLKRVNDLAVETSAPAAPIIIDNSTKNNVTNSRPSSISPRVSSGAPSTAPVMSHIDRALYPFIGAYP